VAKAGNHIEVICRGVLIRAGKVLICRSEKGGYFYLPGGHVEFDEPATIALAREFEEECGIKVAALDCVLVTEGNFDAGRRRHHEVNLVFHVEPVDPTSLDDIKSRESDIGFEWADLASMVDLDLRPNAIRAWLASGGLAGCQWVSEMV
jgi:8-oxo-dGTP pyrophosphatase MutT (NUDIX family)